MCENVCDRAKCPIWCACLGLPSCSDLCCWFKSQTLNFKPKIWIHTGKKHELGQSGSVTIRGLSLLDRWVHFFGHKTLHWLAFIVLWLFTMTWCTNVTVVQSMLTAAVTYKPHSITPNKSQLMLSILGHCRSAPNHRQEQLNHIMKILENKERTIKGEVEIRHTGSQ